MQEATTIRTKLTKVVLKAFLAVLLAIAFLPITALSQPATQAFGNTINISAGDQIEMTIKISGSLNNRANNIYILYDLTKFEYVDSNWLAPEGVTLRQDFAPVAGSIDTDLGPGNGPIQGLPITTGTQFLISLNGAASLSTELDFFTATFKAKASVGITETSFEVFTSTSGAIPILVTSETDGGGGDDTHSILQGQQVEVTVRFVEKVPANPNLPILYDTTKFSIITESFEWLLPDLIVEDKTLSFAYLERDGEPLKDVPNALQNALPGSSVLSGSYITIKNTSADANLTNVNFFRCRFTALVDTTIDAESFFCGKVTGVTREVSYEVLGGGSTDPEPILLNVAKLSDPAKLAYTAGDIFDAAGLAIVANYDDDSQVAITDYTISKTTELAVSDIAITVSGSYEGQDYSYTFPITVSPKTGSAGSGDYDGDGSTTAGEALQLAQIVVGRAATTLTPAQFAAMDMDGDGYLTMTDVLLVMRRAIGL
jgi:hypothetical protein